MPNQKPWRTIIKGDSTGRFTREQIRDAVLAVKAERETAERSKAGRRAPGRNPQSAAAAGSGPAA